MAHDRRARMGVGWITGVAVLLLSTLAPFSAERADAVGQCREKTCPCTKDQLKQGWVDTPQGCSKCNRAALEKAKAEFEKWYAIYKEQSEISDRLLADVDAALEEGRRVLEEYWGGELVSRLPYQMKMAYELSKNSREGQLKAMATALKEMLKLIKGGAYGSAVKVGGVLEMVVRLGIMTEKALMKIEEADSILDGAMDAADAAYESLQKARKAREEMDRLAKDCRQPGQGQSGPAEDDDSWESTAEREAREAREILKKWKKVEGGYEDMEGNFHTADLAFEAALEIVQSGQSSSAAPRYRLASLATDGNGRHVAQARPGLTADEIARFEQALARGVEHLARALEGFDRVLRDVKTIGRLAGARPGSR